MEIFMIIAPIAAILALGYALITALSVKKAPEGSEKMKEIASSIRKGAAAYLKRQYKTVGVFFVAVFVVLLVLAFVPGLELVSSFTPFAFLTGGIFSGLAGFVGMTIAVTANARTAYAAEKSLNSGLKVAFKAGSVMGFTVVGLGLLDFSIWYFITGLITKWDAATMTNAMVTFGIGASSMALFARVGGGIFTKAADVGADLVGKVEAGIPEDDPRNPAVIADNVGDNVGDVAGMGADLYESYVGSLLSSVALGYAAMSKYFAAEPDKAIWGILIPVVIAVIGIVASFVGTFFVKTGENLSSKSLLAALRRGTYIAAIIAAVGSVAFILLTNEAQFWFLAVAMVAGLLGGVLIGYFTEYYTSDNEKPTQNVAGSTTTGPATTIISGLSLGMVSTVIPVVIVSVVVVLSYLICGQGTMGMFGIGVAAVGMLSTLGITLATDAYGPIADNAGGIAEMSGMPGYVRERTDALDSLGNTTAATGKGFAIGSAALTALALLSSFVNLVDPQGTIYNLSVMNPQVLIGGFIGCMLPFLFSALTMSSVGKSAQSIVVEVRRQFREIPGLMEGTGTPDYHTCVDLCTKASLKQMVLPSVITLLAPIVVGVFLGVPGVTGMLFGAIASGFMLAVMMSNAGGAWDNAKKYIEKGAHGGKGSDCHKAAVVGDTVGDPFKDTSGPAINILIKLLSIVAIVFASVFDKIQIFFK